MNQQQQKTTKTFTMVEANDWPEASFESRGSITV
jgi:hypothetical protein